MMRARLAVLSLGFVTSATAAIVACGGTPPELAASPEEAKQTAQASTVSIEMQDAKGARVGSCSGTLVSPNLVLTAGHCVVVAKKFKIANGAGDSATATVAVTPWKNFQSSFSHPYQADIALIRLDKEIRLDSYPKIASSTAKSGADGVKIARTTTNGEAQSADVTLDLGKAKGFRLTYTAGKSEPGSFLDTGGAVLDDNGKVVGVVSGRGRKSGLLYVTRVDLFAKWITSAQTCSADMATKTWGGNPWGGSSSGGSSSGWGGGSSGWGGSMGNGTYGGNGGEIDAGSLPDMPGSESGTGTSGGEATSSSSSGGANGDLSGGAGSCPGIPECVGSDCGTSGTTSGTPGDTSGTTNPNGDDDGDGTPNGQDPLPKIPGKPGDMDGDGISDGQDPLPKIPGKPGDRDGDGIPDGSDSQPDVPNGNGGGTGTPSETCPGEEICPTAPDSANCSGPNCGGCSGQAGCVDDLIDYGDCACSGASTALR